MEDGNAGGLPTKQDDEFRPFVRRLPEFKFWYSATKAISIGFICSWFNMFDLPVFWPVLVIYWFILFALTSLLPPLPYDDQKLMSFHSAEANSTHDQIPLRALHGWQNKVLR